MIVFIILGRVDIEEATDRSIPLTSLLGGLGLLSILLPLSLGASSKARRRLGWIRPRLSDLPQLLLLALSTLLLAGLLPLPGSNMEPDLGGFANATPLILCLLLASITEEIFFRSWMLSTLMASGLSRVLTVAISVAAFALIHLWQGLHGVVVAALVGLIYALFFLYRRNLFVLIGGHAIYNIIAALYHQPPA